MISKHGNKLGVSFCVEYCHINHSSISLVLHIMQNVLWLMEMDLSTLQ